MDGSSTIRFEIDLNVRRNCDVCVVGGGSAGIAATVAAARAGADVLLIEQSGMLGGTSTGALVGPLMTSYSADGSEQVIAGIFQELVDRMVQLDGAIDPGKVEAGTAHGAFIVHGHARLTPCHPEALKLAATQLVVESGARTAFHTGFVTTLKEQDRVTGLVVHDKSGLSVIATRFVVDTSGDADVAARSGVACTKGRPDGHMMPATMFMRIGNVDDARLADYMAAHPGERMFQSIVAKAKADGRWTIPREYLNLYREPAPGEYRANISRLLGIDGTNPDDLSRAEMEGRLQCLEIFRFMRENCPGLEQARLLETASRIGIRETRHIEGLYTLTGDDVVSGKRFDDAIARCAYPIDIHDPTGSTTKMISLDTGDGERGPGSNLPQFYDIPYRSLVPVGVTNMLVAGRPISATHEGAGSARVIPPCYATGQAAGIAAAMATRDNLAAADVDVGALRSNLSQAGAIV